MTFFAPCTESFALSEIATFPYLYLPFHTSSCAALPSLSASRLAPPFSHSSPLLSLLILRLIPTLLSDRLFAAIAKLRTGFLALSFCSLPLFHHTSPASRPRYRFDTTEFSLHIPLFILPISSLFLCLNFYKQFLYFFCSLSLDLSSARCACLYPTTFSFLFFQTVWQTEAAFLFFSAPLLNPQSHAFTTYDRHGELFFQTHCPSPCALRHFFPQGKIFPFSFPSAPDLHLFAPRYRIFIPLTSQSEVPKTSSPPRFLSHALPRRPSGTCSDFSLAKSPQKRPSDHFFSPRRIFLERRQKPLPHLFLRSFERFPSASCSIPF